MTAKDQTIAPCPFCGGAPYFEGDTSEWKDESRYVEMSLACCSTMVERIGWRRARDMTIEARTTELQNNLINSWNKRNEPAPDCRTCWYFHTSDHGDSRYECASKSDCTNGDQYQPAPAVVLWRTE